MFWTTVKLILKCLLFFVQAGPYDSLKDVALKILQNKVSTVPIVHSTAHDGSFPQLLHLASLSGILRCKHYSVLLCVTLHIITLFWQSNDGSLCKVLLTVPLLNYQVFAGTLDTLRVLYQFYSNRFAEFLWVLGFHELGIKVGVQSLC